MLLLLVFHLFMKHEVLPNLLWFIIHALDLMLITLMSLVWQLFIPSLYLHGLCCLILSDCRDKCTNKRLVDDLLDSVVAAFIMAWWIKSLISLIASHFVLMFNLHLLFSFVVPFLPYTIKSCANVFWVCKFRTNVNFDHFYNLCKAFS